MKNFYAELLTHCRGVQYLGGDFQLNFRKTVNQYKNEIWSFESSNGKTHGYSIMKENNGFP